MGFTIVHVAKWKEPAAKSDHTQQTTQHHTVAKRTWIEEFECDETLQKWWREQDYAIAHDEIAKTNALLWRSHVRVVNLYVKCELHMMARVDAKSRIPM